MRALWDSADLDVSEARLRAALDREETDAGRAEVLTQLARVELKRGRPHAAHEVLDEAERLAEDDPVVRARLLLERGRVERRSGDAEEAKRLLEHACDAALAADQPFIAVDAVHARMPVGDMVAWTRRGLGLADRYPGAAYWRRTLLLNLGEWQWEHALYDESFVNCRAALEAREQLSRNPGIRGRRPASASGGRCGRSAARTRRFRSWRRRSRGRRQPIPTGP